MAHLSAITANLVKTTQELNKLLASQQNTIKTTLDNLQATSQQVKTGTENLPVITSNLEKVTKELSEAEFGKMVKNLDATIGELQSTLQKVNDKDGSVGALLNDRKMYDNLASSLNSLNLLMQDLRLNPKRYVNISVFGKKDKSTPLMKPMDEDSVTQEQFKPQ
jgi:phospholipid/cholesterol/gamma-HCH transport system substrate-binding protein